MQTLERVEYLLMRGIDREDLLEGGCGLIVVADLGLPDLADLEQLADLVRRLLECFGALHLHTDHVRPTLIGAIDLLELAHRLEVAGVDVEQVAPG